jgi:GTP-binding protein HflX
VSDTVGFIRNLPTTLVEAFRATLEEVTDAALVLHAVDASSPAAPEHVAHVRKVLAEIGAGNIPQLLVLNKIDRLDAGFDDAAWGRRMGNEDSGGLRAVGISAVTGMGVDRLVAAIDEVLPFDPILRAVYRFPAADGATLALLHACGKVLEVRYEGSECLADVEAPESLGRRVSRFRQNPQICGKPCGKEPLPD